MTQRQRYPNSTESVTAARHFVREALRDQPTELSDEAELMTSELVTNCIRHAGTGFELTLRLEGEIRIEVLDTGGGEPTVLSPSPRDPSGRGLRIVEAMASAWGVHRTPEGKTVWFTLARPALAPGKSDAAAGGLAAERSERMGDRSAAGQPHAKKRSRRAPEGRGLRLRFAWPARPATA
jgi:anti-sigma regulatory factor (Ser/Thr protein kinase)